MKTLNEKIYPQFFPPTDEELQRDLEMREEAAYQLTPYGKQLLLDLEQKKS